ncbi:VMA21-like domain-containing protein [Viridothelium virens]|uniref:VMA21-like domain-containing protein n=1 Tax=Viridothelium virens TaxID=1048519 RepID=A0A6A6H8V7_VIRVR|nr:VMA21-like domain-containing protein [Viridothelium virens]
MATRRIVSDGKDILERNDLSSAPAGSSEKSNISPAVPTSVIVKLLGFTFAMISLPIGTYFLSVNTIFGGNSTFAGASAAVIANVVLIAYVVVAMREDQSEQMATEQKQKKAE